MKILKIMQIMQKLCKLRILHFADERRRIFVMGIYSFTKPTQGDDQAVCPHHKGAGPPNPIRVEGPDLWYQMALVDTTVERSLVSSAGGARR